MISFSWQITTSGEATGEARDLALDPVDGDLLVVDGDLVIVRGVEAIASDLRSRLQTFAGEYFLDTTIGIPWLVPSAQYPAVLGGKPNLPRLTEMFRAAILETPGVLEVLQLSVVNVGRELRVAFRASTDLDQVITAALALSAGGN